MDNGLKKFNGVLEGGKHTPISSQNDILFVLVCVMIGLVCVMMT